MFDKVVSLGNDCQSAWQIRKYFDQPEAYPFDWVNVPPSSIVDLLESDFHEVADEQHFEVVDHAENIRFVVIDRRNRMAYMHDFSRDDHNRVVDSWRDEAPAAKQKYNFLVDRFQTLMSAPKRILFLSKQHDLSPDSCRAMVDVLDRKYPKIDFHVLFVGLPMPGLPPLAEWDVERASVRYLTLYPGGDTNPMEWRTETFADLFREVGALSS